MAYLLVLALSLGAAPPLCATGCGANNTAFDAASATVAPEGHMPNISLPSQDNLQGLVCCQWCQSRRGVAWDVVALGPDAKRKGSTVYSCTAYSAVSAAATPRPGVVSGTMTPAPTPPPANVTCGSNAHGPDNSPLCLYILNNSTRISHFTLGFGGAGDEGSSAVNTSFVRMPAKRWTKELWVSMGDGEYWPPNPHLQPFTAAIWYTAHAASGGDQWQVKVTETLTSAFDTAWENSKGIELGGYGDWPKPRGDQPFVIGLVVNDA
jgi:hypothetical protein